MEIEIEFKIYILRQKWRSVNCYKKITHSKVEEVIENSVSGESRRGGEDKVLDDLEKVVLKIFFRLNNL